MSENSTGPDVERAVSELSPSSCIMLENIRFHSGEENNDDELAKNLAKLADVYVNDAFAVSHRAHSSVAKITEFVKVKCAGFLLEKEIKYLSKLLHNPEKPFVTILGGSKVSDKILVIENLLPKISALLIGGAMAYTFMKAKGEKTGSSKYESDRIETAKAIIEKAKSIGVEILFPIDHIIAKSFETTAQTKEVKEIEEGFLAVDIGPATLDKFKSKLKDAKTILWNGPVGAFEIDNFSKGTKGLAEFIAELKSVRVIGGGDSVAACEKFKVKDKMSHISTGGGACLEFLEGKELPGIKALNI